MSLPASGGFAVRATNADVTSGRVRSIVWRRKSCFALPQSLTLVFDRALRLRNVPAIRVRSASTRREPWTYELVDATTGSTIAVLRSAMPVREATGFTIRFDAAPVAWPIVAGHSYVFALRGDENPQVPCGLNDFDARLGLRRA